MNRIIIIAGVLAFVVGFVGSVFQGERIQPTGDVMQGVKIEARYRAGRVVHDLSSLQ